MGKIIGSILGTNNTGLEDATREAAAKAEATARETQRQRDAQAKAQADMEANFNADLKGDNKATVVAGGTAEALGVGDDALRRRRAQGGLASTLGVNV